uniref:IclR family transcriptional regulator n=1 Tax=Paenirhodobacter enshiensis TaxID=1105367 RepID=UPI0035B0EF6C
MTENGPGDSRQPGIPVRDISLTFMKGMTVLRAFDEEHSHLTLAEISRLTGIERAVVRRLVLTLVQMGYVRKEANRYALTPHILVLGGSFLRANQFGRLVQPLIEMCAQDLGFSVGLAMGDGTDAVYVAQGSQSNARYTFGFTVGSRLPLLTTSIGRMLLAWGDPDWAKGVIETAPLQPHTPETLLDRAAIARAVADSRATGVSITQGEFEAGATGIAVPVGPLGVAKAALGFSEPAATVPPEDYDRCIAVLRRYAGNIAAVMS